MPAGTTYPPVRYLVGREKVREFARSVGETDPRHLDPEAARAAGHADVVAPPMFAVVYTAQAMATALFDPETAIDFAMLVHGAQEFVWGPLVVAGDEIATTASLREVTSKGELGVYVFATESVNDRGETVCTGTWTQYVRRAA